MYHMSYEAETREIFPSVTLDPFGLLSLFRNERFSNELGELDTRAYFEKDHALRIPFLLSQCKVQASHLYKNDRPWG